MGNWLVDGMNYIPFMEQMASSSWLLAETSFLTRLGTNLWLALQVALGLGFVIFVHELGHFLAAKTFGVRCDKFYVGFDVPISIGPIKFPSTLGKFQWGETEYGIGIIPLGGYVKMLGQDDDPRNAEEEAAKLRIGEGEDAPLDPRSYPAKPVWQRMIIISAGVVMNLIFAVILAGFAYSMGVPYRPTIAGSVVAGSPAWEIGIQPGDKILKLGDQATIDEQMRYNDFATSVVMKGLEFKGKSIPLTIRRDGSEFELDITPSPKYHPKGFYLVGMGSSTESKVGKPAFDELSYLATQKPDLEPGDRVIAVDGEQLPVDERTGKILGYELTSRLQASWNRPVSITIERTKGEGESATSKQHDIELQPVPVKSLGVNFKVGPITALQNGSLAEQAGLKVGDVIQTVNGEAIENALQLPALVASLAGQSMTVGVARGSVESPEMVEVEISDLPPARFDPPSDRYGELTLGGVGVAFTVTPELGSVDGALSESGLQPGDELRQIQWILDDDEKKKFAQEFNAQSLEPIVIDETTTLAFLFSLTQAMPEGAEFRAVFSRDGKNLEPVTLKLSYAEDWYWHQRGISMASLMETRVADDFGSAAALGFWETKRRFNEVLNFLRLLVTGYIGMDGLGGPGRIAYVAASEASFGPSRLMIFLTMLSANLAILNFLPIPALDGGHMLFLTAEAIRGKPVSEALQVRLTMLGVLGLLSLMAFVIVKDILWFAN